MRFNQPESTTRLLIHLHHESSKGTFKVDDFAKSSNRRSDRVVLETERIVPKRKFQLDQMLSNTLSLMESFDDADNTEKTIKSCEADSSTSSLLGQQWYIGDDSSETCRFATNEVPGKITQRVILSFVASVFEPLGFFAPFTMRMRNMLKTILWDEEIARDDKMCFED